MNEMTRGTVTDGGDTLWSADLAGGTILTVGRLLAALEGVDPAIQVVVDDGDGWFRNLVGVIVPAADGDGEYSAVTLEWGGPIDARQF